MKTITVNVSSSVYEEFRDYSRKVDRPVSELIRQAMEDFRDARLRSVGSVRNIPALPVGRMIRDIDSSDDTLGEMVDDVRH